MNPRGQVLLFFHQILNLEGKYGLFVIYEKDYHFVSIVYSSKAKVLIHL